MNKPLEYIIQYKEGKAGIVSIVGATQPFKDPAALLKDTADAADNFHVRLVFHFPGFDISTGQPYCYGQEYYTEEKQFYPSIHFIFQDNALNRFNGIVDGSIWNYRVKVDSGYKERYGEVIKMIRENYRFGLYNLVVAREYAEFHARILRQSYLDTNGAHGQHVSPFLFHSEKGISEMLQKEEDLFKRIKGTEWRFLLVDDYAKAELRTEPVEFKPAEGTRKTKTDILDRLIQPLLEGHCKYQIDIVNTIDTAKEALRKQKYDIIFLDYLIKEPPDAENQKIRYGYEILNWIDDPREEKLNIGPGDKYYFMFISPYSTAVQERILTEGLLVNDESWYLGQGACPINTPELFKYYLLKLMESRLNQLAFSKEEVCNTITEIFQKDSNQTTYHSVRQKARNEFLSVVEFRNKIFKLRKDTGKGFERESGEAQWKTDGSVLAEYHMRNFPKPSFWEHLMHLVYLTAFGTILQWGEMWEEYMYLRTDFIRHFGAPKGTTSAPSSCPEGTPSDPSSNPGLAAVQKIEDYLLHLKQTSR